MQGVGDLVLSNLLERVACARTNSCNAYFVFVSSIYMHTFSLSLSLPRSRSLARARALSEPPECQKLAWKAGHKRECVTAAAGAGAVGSQARDRALGMRRDTAVRLTDKVMRLWEKMKDLYAKQDWRRLAAFEDEARTVVTLAPPNRASCIYSTLGIFYYRMGQYGKAMGLHEENKKIAEEVGDRAGVGWACGNLGNCYYRMGQYGRAIALHSRQKRSSSSATREAAKLGSYSFAQVEWAMMSTTELALHRENRALFLAAWMQASPRRARRLWRRWGAGQEWGGRAPTCANPTRKMAGSTKLSPMATGVFKSQEKCSSGMKNYMQRTTWALCCALLCARSPRACR